MAGYSGWNTSRDFWKFCRIPIVSWYNLLLLFYVSFISYFFWKKLSGPVIYKITSVFSLGTYQDQSAIGLQQVNITKRFYTGGNRNVESNLYHRLFVQSRWTSDTTRKSTSLLATLQISKRCGTMGIGPSSHKWCHSNWTLRRCMRHSTTRKDGWNIHESTLMASTKHSMFEISIGSTARGKVVQTQNLGCNFSACRVVHESFAARHIPKVHHRWSAASRSSVGTRWQRNCFWKNICSDRNSWGLGMDERHIFFSKQLEGWGKASRMLSVWSTCNTATYLLPCGERFQCLANRIHHGSWVLDPANATEPKWLDGASMFLWLFVLF